jgi:hypothetical protein
MAVFDFSAFRNAQGAVVRPPGLFLVQIRVTTMPNRKVIT